MRKKLLKSLLILILYSHSGYSQNNRINDYNQIGWYNLFTTLKFTPKVGIHLEYQFRRTNWILNWQQSLLRTGLNYQLKDKVLFRAGYAWVITFPYSENTIQKFGKVFPEHRAYEMVQLSDNIGRVGFQHRFMLEQRFIGKFNDSTSIKVDGFSFVNRLRYMCRVNVPINKPKLEKNTVYFTAYDEVMIGFGKNIGSNIFDQNRFGALIGFQANSVFRFEAGFLSQIIMLGRTINNRNVMHYDNGVIANMNVNLELYKKKK